MTGLSSTGFLAKTEQEIRDDIKSRARSFFGSGIETDADSAVMNVFNPVIIELEELWQGAQLLYEFQNPNAAEGVSLDNIGAITNTPRIEGAKSTVVVQATGTPGSVIPQFYKRGVQDTGDLFQTLTSQVLPIVGSQPLEFTMEALEDGPITAIAGTLNQGALPSGVTSIINAVDATEGSFDETDEEYRISRKERLAATGAATVVSIKAALLGVAGVTSVAVFENDTGVTDSNGLPPHSIRALVAGGTDQDIIDTLGVKKGAGTFTDGSISGTYTDPVDGQAFTIRFSRVTAIGIYVAVNVTSKDASYPVTGDQDIEDAILALEWDVGEDVVLPKLQNAVTSVPGIITYTLFFDTSASPVVDSTIVIAVDEQADFDSTRITVTS